MKNLYHAIIAITIRSVKCIGNKTLSSVSADQNNINK